MCLCSDVNKIREGIGDKVGNFLQWTTAFVAGLILGLAYGWKLALVIIAVSPLLAICGGFMTHVSYFLGLSASTVFRFFYLMTFYLKRKTAFTREQGRIKHYANEIAA